MLLKPFRRHLGAKLFLSYLAVIIVGVLSLAVTAKFAVPSAFESHLQSMREFMADSLSTELEADLYQSFQLAVTRALAIATLAAAVVAIVASFLVSGRVVAPVRQMMLASSRIAEGRYADRVAVPGDVARGDLDELGELALRFNQMAARLEGTESMRRQLIGDVTHELRTPLTMIKGSMEGLIDGVLPANEDTFQQVYQEADRLARLVNDLQELSRVEAGAYELHRQPVIVETLVRGVVERLGRQYEDKGVGLGHFIPHDLPAVWADEDRIGQVLLNLAGNALQYTPEGGDVTITAQHAGAEVRITVADTGVGIAVEHLPHLFTRFYRVDKARARASGGSGIGLTIARHLVEAHGGRILATSSGLGRGSTFTFTLPLSSSHNSDS